MHRELFRFYSTGNIVVVQLALNGPPGRGWRSTSRRRPPVGGVPGPGNREMRRAGWLPDDVASVDEEVDAGHECCGGAEQEDDGTYHVLRLGVPA